MKLHEEASLLSAKIATAVSAVLPPGFRGKVQFTVDGGNVLPHNVSVSIEFRPPQPGARRTEVT